MVSTTPDTHYHTALKAENSLQVFCRIYGLSTAETDTSNPWKGVTTRYWPSLLHERWR